MGRATKLKAARKEAELLKLDFGCGPNKREGFLGVDSRAFPGVDHVVDVVRRKPGVSYADTLGPAEGDLTLSYEPWPWADGSVGAAHASHFIEHLTRMGRVHFLNELYRVLVPGGTCQVIVPHWASCRAYGDLTHEWPPISEFWFYYLDRNWRAANAPHNDAYRCHFAAGWGYSYRADLNVRSQDWQQFAIANYKEVCQDTIATLTKA